LKQFIVVLPPPLHVSPKGWLGRELTLGDDPLLSPSERATRTTRRVPLGGWRWGAPFLSPHPLLLSPDLEVVFSPDARLEVESSVSVKLSRWRPSFPGDVWEATTP
jgi:hypothetical protein